MAKLLFIGCGKMGGAIVRGLSGKGHEIAVVDPAKPDVGPSVLCVSSREELPPFFSPDAVLIAVKPQAMSEVLPQYGVYKDSVFLSIAAGQTLARLATLFGDDTRAIVRAMPNLPACVGKGITVVLANAQVYPAQRDLCTEILSAVGQVEWVEDEALIDPVTALSGSGPAYVFALVEAMAKAGENLGLSTDLARKLARQTVVGSGSLLETATETAADLRVAVTSKGGTTAAALGHLQAEDGLDALLFRAMEAAARRAKELSA